MTDDCDGSVADDRVMNDDDRVTLMLDIGDEYDGHLHNDIDSVDSGQVMPLEGGDEAEITIDTATGGTTEVPINPPETLEGKKCRRVVMKTELVQTLECHKRVYKAVDFRAAETDFPAQCVCKLLASLAVSASVDCRSRRARARLSAV